MAKIINGRVRQKAAPLAEWQNSDLESLDGEQLFVRSDVDDAVIGFKFGAKGKKFSELPYPDLTVRDKATPSMSWTGRQSGVYIPTTNGNYNGVNVNLTEGYQVLYWDGATVQKVVYPTDYTGAVFGGVIDDTYDLSTPPTEPTWYIASSGTYNTTPTTTLTETSILTWNGQSWSHIPFELEVRGEFLVADNIQEVRNITPEVAQLLVNGTYKGVTVLGYYEPGDTPYPINYYISDTPGADDGGSVIDVGDIKLVHEFLFILDGSYYGISSLNSDNSYFINKAIDYVKLNKPMVLRFPPGVIKYSSIQNIAINADGVTYEGHAPNCTTLEFTGGGAGSIAMNANAWEGSTLNTPFARNITIRNINLLLSPTTKTGLHLEGVSRSIFQNIRINGGDKTDGIAIVSAVMLSHFYNLRCSYADGEVPYEALRSTGMVRGGTQNHNNSDNTYYDIQLEGTAIGATLLRTDQSTFIGGVIEACTYRGLVINGTSGGRYNTFIGTSFESALAEWDILDNGTHNFYSGIYAPYMNIQGSMNKVANAFFSLLQISSSGQDNILENITYSRWVYAGRTHGLVDNGIRTRKTNTFNYATGIRDKNYGLFDGSIISDSFRNRVITNYSENLAKADSLGGLIPFQNSSNIDSNIPSGGSGIAVQRRGAGDASNDTGAWRLWTSNLNDNKFKFLKLNSTGVWNSINIISDVDLATETTKGVVNRGVHVPDGSSIDTLLASLRNAGIISSS